MIPWEQLGKIAFKPLGWTVPQRVDAPYVIVCECKTFSLNRTFLSVSRVMISMIWALGVEDQA